MPIKYYLQPNPITPDPNDQSARILHNQTVNLDGIVSRVLSRGSTLTETDILAVLKLSFEVIADTVADGNSVVLPLVNIRPGVSGVFHSATDSFDPHRHVKKASLSAEVQLNAIVQNAKVEKVTGTPPSPSLTEYFDINTQSANSIITRGGIGRIVGSELKFNPANEQEGIFFINAELQATKVTVIASRTEGKLVFSIPDSLTEGNYTLEVRKGYGNAATIRTGTLTEILVVS